MKVKSLPKIDLEQLHFCKSSKARYRVHLTVGIIVSAALAVFGTMYHHEMLTHFATLANTWTAILWIWE